LAMKIDSKIQFPDDRQADRVGARKVAVTPSVSGSHSAGVSSPSGEDTFSISGTHSEIQRLSAAAKQVSDVRPARVAALQNQVRSGHFNPDSGKVADALIAEQNRPAKG